MGDVTDYLGTDTATDDECAATIDRLFLVDRDFNHAAQPCLVFLGNQPSLAVMGCRVCLFYVCQGLVCAFSFYANVWYAPGPDMSVGLLLRTLIWYVRSGMPTTLCSGM